MIETEELSHVVIQKVLKGSKDGMESFRGAIQRISGLQIILKFDGGVAAFTFNQKVRNRARMTFSDFSQYIKECTPCADIPCFQDNYTFGLD